MQTSKIASDTDSQNYVHKDFPSPSTPASQMAIEIVFHKVVEHRFRQRS